MDLQVKIGKRIKALREERKLKQEDLAWQSNLDRSYMNHVENGKRNVSVDTLTKIICSGLGMSFKDFFNQDLFNGKKKSK